MQETQHNHSQYHHNDIVVSNYDKDLKEVAEFLLSKEKYILDNCPIVSDFGSLLPSFVTTRAGSYNVFQFIDECPQLGDIKRYIIDQYWKYVEDVGFKEYAVKPGINCWFNVVRNGEKIIFHKHSENERSFVSATMCIQVEDTQSIYKKNGEVVKTVENKEGQFTIFKCDLEHGTTTHISDVPRVTLGIDIFFNTETTKAAPELYNSISEF